MTIDNELIDNLLKDLPYLLQAAKLNDPHCQDLQEAIFWYRRAAGNTMTGRQLGNLALHYEKGGRRQSESAKGILTL